MGGKPSGALLEETGRKLESPLGAPRITEQQRHLGSSARYIHDYMTQGYRPGGCRSCGTMARKKRIPLYVSFTDFTKAYDSVDQTLLRTVLARFGVPQKIISVVRQLHDGMRAYVRLDDRVCLGWFAVEQGLRQGCVLAYLLRGG